MPRDSLRGHLLALGAVLVLTSAEAFAQTSDPPGPYVIDLRGASVGVPVDAAFFPDLAADAPIPARAFGLDVGAHVYPLSLGHGRVGLGANVLWARGNITDPSVSTVVTAIVPQISINFGSRDGWSYLSGGYGTAMVRSEAPIATTTIPDDGSMASTDSVETVADTAGGIRESGRVGAFNVGGGARWFLRSHVAIGFDVRFHRVAAGTTANTPATTLVAASVGLSLR